MKKRQAVVASELCKVRGERGFKKCCLLSLSVAREDKCEFLKGVQSLMEKKEGTQLAS